MTMVTWQDYLVKREYYRDLMREAKQEGLIREALAGHTKASRLHSRALSGLGHLLVIWGRRLQSRYGPIVSAPGMPQSVPGR